MSQRVQHSQLISKYEGIIADLGDGADPELKSSLEVKISSSKRAIMAARPLDQQVTALEAFLDRQLNRVLDCQRTIMAEHERMIAIQNEVASKRAELESLKAQQIAAIGVAPPAPPTPPDILAQMSQMCAAIRGLQQTFSTLPGISEDTRNQVASVLTPLLAPPSTVPVPGLPAASASAPLPVPPNGGTDVPAPGTTRRPGSRSRSPFRESTSPSKASASAEASVSAKIAMNAEHVESITSRISTPCRATAVNITLADAAEGASVFTDAGMSASDE